MSDYNKIYRNLHTSNLRINEEAYDDAVKSLDNIINSMSYNVTMRSTAVFNKRELELAYEDYLYNKANAKVSKEIRRSRTYGKCVYDSFYIAAKMGVLVEEAQLVDFDLLNPVFVEQNFVEIINGIFNVKDSSWLYGLRNKCFEYGTTVEYVARQLLTRSPYNHYEDVIPFHLVLSSLPPEVTDFSLDMLSNLAKCEEVCSDLPYTCQELYDILYDASQGEIENRYVLTCELTLLHLYIKFQELIHYLTIDLVNKYENSTDCKITAYSKYLGGIIIKVTGNIPYDLPNDFTGGDYSNIHLKLNPQILKQRC